jgi:protein-S-isoprenylcysteine O-methyltransferase Ste14
MSENEKDAAAVRIPPPIVFVSAIVAGVLLQWLLVPLRIELSSGLRAGVAIAAIVGGFAIGGSAFGIFRRIGQDPAPWTPTPEVVTTGIYRVTLNPMYVGMSLVQFGAGIALANGWVLLLIPVSMLIVQRTAIRHEEAYLERKFGEGYLVYKRSVRRWL